VLSGLVVAVGLVSLSLVCLHRQYAR